MSFVKSRIYCKDARQLFSTIRSPIVDTIITSPPYADLKDYEAEGQIGFGQNYSKEYLPALYDVFNQCYKISKPEATLWIVVDTFKKNGVLKLLPFDIATICTEIGWTLQDIIIWDKGKTLPWSHKGRMRNLFEYVLFFSKNSSHKYYPDKIKDPDDLKEWWVKYPERYGFGGKNPSNIWRIGIPVQGSWSNNDINHACPFPPELIERIILLTTDSNDVVLDPFAGSGMVLAQAKCMGRKYLGFEINKNYIKQFRQLVLPSMAKRWTKIQEQLTQIDARRNEFKNILENLRIIKYPKVVFKALQNNSKSKAKLIKAIYVKRLGRISNSTNKFTKIAVTFLVEPGINIKDIHNEIEQIAAKPPASKFGIIAEFTIMVIGPSKSFQSILGSVDSTEVFVYRDGITHWYKNNLSSEPLDLYNHDNNMRKRQYIPPIISPIGVQQKLVRTWRKENDKQTEF